MAKSVNVRREAVITSTSESERQSKSDSTSSKKYNPKKVKDKVRLLAIRE